MIIYLNKYGEELGTREYIEFQWNRKCFEPGNFSLLLRREDWDDNIKYIQLDGRPETGIVQKVQYEHKLDGEYITASGFFIEKLLDWGMYYTDAEIGNDLRTAMNIICYCGFSQYTDDLKNKMASSVDLWPPQDLPPPMTQNLYCAYVKEFSGAVSLPTNVKANIPAGKPVGSAIYDLLRTYDYKFVAKPVFNTKGKELSEPLIGLELYVSKLKDKRDDIFFNKRLGSAKKVEYMLDDSGVATKIVGVQVLDPAINYSKRIYVYHDGKYQPAIYEAYTYSPNSPSNVGNAVPLKVIYTSANNIETGRELHVRAQMQNALKLELLNNYKVEHIECEAVQGVYSYPGDYKGAYDLGDYCTIQIDELELEYSAKIVEIREVYHKNINEIEIILGTPTRKEYKKVI